ncbi:MAG: transglycosylase SLT domain-containing protein [Myxococcota bacterium]|nr:transglycosylase SLT domain-containing protein [Myxococcota bacterium]
MRAAKLAVVVVGVGLGLCGAAPHDPPAPPSSSFAVSGGAWPPEVRAAATRIRAARAAARKDGAKEGARQLAETARAHPELADHLALLEARVWLEANEPEPAEATLRKALAKAPRSPLAGELEQALGDALAARGQLDAAHRAWRRALESGVREPTPLQLRLAESLERSGAIEAAAQDYRTVWVEAPASAEAQTAATRLDALEARLERSLRRGRDHLERADRLYRKQHSAAALAEYEAALAAGDLSSARAGHARERRARCLFRLRRYPEAAAAFEALDDDPNARVWAARALARQDRVEESIERLEAIGRAGTSSSSWARYLAGLLHAGRDRHEAARAHFERVARGPASDSMADSALWQLGWLAYREGDRPEARSRFRDLVRRQRDPIERLGARYWAARALDPEEPVRAREELAAIATEYPFSYYGWRAGQQLGSGTGAAPTQAPLPAGRDALAAVDLFRAQTLLAAGLTDEGLAELRPLAQRARSLRDHLALGRLHAAGGDFHGAQRLVLRSYLEPLARGVVPQQADLWRLAWPDAWADEVRRALPDGSPVEPALVHAVMREESGYRAEVVSVTGALGLLQIMPSTGERLASEVGLEPFAPESLLAPLVNLRLGGFYLDQLARRFPERAPRVPAMVASYNAGPEAVEGWLADAKAPEDVWIESIPYSQTRGYVKRVMRSLHVYRVLYP